MLTNTTATDSSCVVVPSSAAVSVADSLVEPLLPLPFPPALEASDLPGELSSSTSVPVTTVAALESSSDLSPPVTSSLLNDSSSTASPLGFSEESIAGVVRAMSVPESNEAPWSDSSPEGIAGSFDAFLSAVVDCSLSNVGDFVVVAGVSETLELPLEITDTTATTSSSEVVELPTEANEPDEVLPTLVEVPVLELANPIDAMREPS